MDEGASLKMKNDNPQRKAGEKNISNAAKIGKMIKTFRVKHDMIVDDLAARTSLPVGGIEDIEGGASPALGVMVKLARALGQRVRYLSFYWSGKR